jgi:hypothetical protein
MNYKIFMVCIAMPVMNIDGAERERAAPVAAALENLRTTFIQEIDSLSLISGIAVFKSMDAETIRKFFEPSNGSLITCGSELVYIGEKKVGEKSGIVLSTDRFPLTQEAFNRLKHAEES